MRTLLLLGTLLFVAGCEDKPFSLDLEERTPVKNAGGEKQIAIRAEIFEMPRELALQIIESAAKAGEHSPEREAAMAAVKAGEARLIACPSIICKSGQRAKILTGNEKTYFLKELDGSTDLSNEETSKNEMAVKMENDFRGTTLEVDPVLGADDSMVDLNLALSHWYAPRRLSRNTDETQKLVSEIILQMTLKDGNYLLAGNWNRPAEPHVASDLECIVFVTASVQYP